MADKRAVNHGLSGTGTAAGRRTMIGLYVVGWSLVSIRTLGICAGLNPGLYQDM